MKLFLPFLALATAQVQPGLLRKSAESIQNHGIDILFNQVEVDKNMVISPLSIIGCMYMLAAGAAGESREEILTALDFGKVFQNRRNSKNAVKMPFKAYKEILDELTEQESDGYILEIANGMFHQKDMGEYTPNRLNGQYVNLLKENFIKTVSNIQELDFAGDSAGATESINKWISKTTHGKIPELFSEPLDSNTLLVLASSLYFKAAWNTKFDIAKGSTKDGFCFARNAQDLLASVCDDVIILTKEESVVSYEFPGYLGPKGKVFEIPLKNTKVQGGDISNKFSMQIWLPDKYITGEEFDTEFRNFIKEKFPTIRRMMPQKVKSIIRIPQFSIEYKGNIVESLKALGIHKVFDESAADLSPMLGDDNNAFVSKVTHAVKFDLDKDGIEGAAVTTAEIHSRTYTQPVRLDVDRPFYFVVSNRCWEEDGDGKSCPYGNIPLFIGRVTNPTLSTES